MSEATIYDELCTGCAEIKPQGIIAVVSHSCALNTVNYYVGRVTLRKFHQLMSNISPVQSFWDLVSKESLPHFQPIKENSHPIDENNFRLEREFEIKYMKRIRNYILLEEKFDSKY